jgi:beta-galactosidase
MILGYGEQGIISGVENGVAISVDLFQKPNRKAYNGMYLVILKATEKLGLITLTVKSKGLKRNCISILTKK